MIRIAPLPAVFRPQTSHVYPPFKTGRYLEEYAWEWFSSSSAKGGQGEQGKQEEQEQETWVYLPVFWTNLQNHPGFSSSKGKYQFLLNQCVRAYPVGTRFFTCVQHDDGAGLVLPSGTRVYGACTGDVPLPLIYEDTTERLLHYPRRRFQERDLLLSFVGTVGTHPVREVLRRALEGRDRVVFSSRGVWSPTVGSEHAEQFLEVTSRSRFCLAPRGYGRSSFRFFEAMLLDVVPVYVWDDVEWLPYKGDGVQALPFPYSSFCISVHVSEVGGLYERLAGIGEEEYEGMRERIRQVRAWFGLEGMCRWMRGDLCGRVRGRGQ